MHISDLLNDDLGLRDSKTDVGAGNHAGTLGATSADMLSNIYCLCSDNNIHAYETLALLKSLVSTVAALQEEVRQLKTTVGSTQTIVGSAIHVDDTDMEIPHGRDTQNTRKVSSVCAPAHSTMTDCHILWYWTGFLDFYFHT